MIGLKYRDWVPADSENLVQAVAARTADEGGGALVRRIEALAERNREIHERQCFNLNPAANIMNRRAEALLSSGLVFRA